MGLFEPKGSVILYMETSQLSNMMKLGVSQPEANDQRMMSPPKPLTHPQMNRLPWTKLSLHPKCLIGGSMCRC